MITLKVAAEILDKHRTSVKDILHKYGIKPELKSVGMTRKMFFDVSRDRLEEIKKLSDQKYISANTDQALKRLESIYVKPPKFIEKGVYIRNQFDYQDPKPQDNDSQNLDSMLKEIEILLKSGVSQCGEIHSLLLKKELLIKKGGKPINNLSLSRYISKVKNKIDPERRSVSLETIEMFKYGSTVEEIVIALKTDRHYVRKVLRSAKLIKIHQFDFRKKKNVIS